MICLKVARVAVALAFALIGPAFAGPAVQDTSGFDFTGLPVNQAVSLYYKMVSKLPYFICSDVLADARPVSIRASGKTLEGPVIELLLESYGYEAKRENGVTYICKKLMEHDDDAAIFLYRPLHRDAAYLVDFVSPLIKGTFANKRAAGSSLAVGGAPSGTTGGTVQTNAVASPAPAFKPTSDDDYIVFSGTEKEIAKLQKLLAQVDMPAGEVVLKGYIYEVGTNDSDSAALDVFLSALGGKLSLQSAVSHLVGNSLRLRTTSIDVVASMLKSDGRFKVVTSPFARVRSGRTARFVVGSDVPVLGAIVTNQAGQTQQAVEYRSSGTIFEVSPKVRDKSTDIDLFQQVSSFVNTDTGVNSSPTLNKRELRTSLTVDDGEILVIGGLNDSKEEMARSGFSLLPFSFSKSHGKRSSELLLVLEVKRI